MPGPTSALSSDVGLHASSPLLRRLVIGPPSALASGVPSPIGAEAGPALLQLVRGWRANHHEGTGAMLERQDYAHLLRRLADEVLLLGVSSDGPITTLATPEWLEVAAVLYPDAVIVDGPVEVTTVGGGLAPRIGPALGHGELVVILGCARSGTTWLEHLVMAHPVCGGLDTAESFVFYDLRKLWKLLTDRADIPRSEAVRILREHCDALFAAALLRRSPDATFFVEKTPLHSLQLPMIDELYPDAHYLHLIRDGRDVARSLADVEFYSDMDVRSGARLWREVLEAVRTSAPSLGDYREVRYEGLVGDPVAGVSEILDWLGLRVDAEVTARIDDRAGQRVSVHGTTGAVGPGKWTQLSPKDIAGIYAEAGDLLVAEGYITEAELAHARRPRLFRRR